jgi:arginyl-tRNA synthetase
MRKACEILGGSAEVIACSVIEPADNRQWRQAEDELMQMLSRRPCTLGDVVAASGRKPHEVAKYLQRLASRGLIEQIGDTDPYYRCVTGG